MTTGRVADNANAMTMSTTNDLAADGVIAMAMTTMTTAHADGRDETMRTMTIGLGTADAMTMTTMMIAHVADDEMTTMTVRDERNGVARVERPSRSQRGF